MNPGHLTREILDASVSTGRGLAGDAAEAEFLKGEGVG
jgi:hypothetical protein